MAQYYAARQLILRSNDIGHGRLVPHDSDYQPASFSRQDSASRSPSPDSNAYFLETCGPSYGGIRHLGPQPQWAGRPVNPQYYPEELIEHPHSSSSYHQGYAVNPRPAEHSPNYGGRLRIASNSYISSSSGGNTFRCHCNEHDQRQDHGYDRRKRRRHSTPCQQRTAIVINGHDVMIYLFNEY
ncbi:hypothetical protein M422DRAFT_40808 [Sphaerobolus stellatus SS14]|nr:hypothetical protein M422DRAFT_40808 [Sphaerobolus stellatus SS14]